MFKKYIPLLIVLGIFCSSCTDTTSLTNINSVVELGAPPTITGPAASTALVFTEEDENKAVPALTWTPADFGYEAAVTYEAQIDLAGNDFSKPISLGQINGLAMNGLTVGGLNSLLFSQGLPDGAPLNMEVRIVATVSNEVDPLISAPLPVTLTLYEVIIIYPKLHLPGDYQEWDPSTQRNVIFSIKSNKKYEGFNYFGLDDAVFKFTDGPSWDVNWGDEEPDGKLDAAGIGNDIPIGGAAGVYFLKCNINALNYTIEPASMGVAGSAAGGNDDIDLMYDEENNWLTVTTDLSAGDIVFRGNDDNAFILGDNDANGRLQFEGANIPIAEAGNYTINLKILNEAEYKYELIKN